MLKTRNGLTLVKPSNVKVEFDQAYLYIVRNGGIFMMGFTVYVVFLKTEYYIN